MCLHRIVLSLRAAAGTERWKNVSSGPMRGTEANCLVVGGRARTEEHFVSIRCNHQKHHILEDRLSHQTSVGWQERTVVCGRLVAGGQPPRWCCPWRRWAATQRASLAAGRQPKALGRGSLSGYCTCDTSMNFLKNQPTWIGKCKVYMLMNTKVSKQTPEEPWTFLDL